MKRMTKAEKVIYELNELVFKDLKNVNNNLTIKSGIGTMYYTFQEMYDTHFKGDVLSFMGSITDNDGVYLNDDYLFYDTKTNPAIVTSISEEDLDEKLGNNIPQYAYIILKNYDLKTFKDIKMLIKTLSY